MARASSSRSARAVLRRGAQRASATAADRYRSAVLDHSRWLPAYLTAVDAADVTVRAARRVKGVKPGPRPWSEAEPGVPTVLAAGLSAAGELSLVLAGPAPWLASVGAVGLGSGPLDGGLPDRSAGLVRVVVPLPVLGPGRRRVVLLDEGGAELPAPVIAPAAVPAEDDCPTRLEVADGLLTLVSAPGAPAVEHRVSTGVARLDVQWAPPPGAAPELLLHRPDGTVAARVAGSTTAGGRLLAACIDAGTLDVSAVHGDRELRVTVAGPDGPIPLARAPYPSLAGAPVHGTARLGHVRVSAVYDAANRLQLRLQHAA